MRFGNKSTKCGDPKRHSISDADKFLECGQKMQSILSGTGRNAIATAVNDNSSSTTGGLQGVKSSTPHS